MERYHPGVITLYFAAMLVFTAWFQQPVFLALSLFTALVVSKATLGGQWGRRLGWSLLLGAIIGIWWAVFARFGDTILIDNLLGNPLTLEGLVYSATLWVRVTAVVLWWESLLRLVPAERLLTLTGKVFPHLSLYGTVLLRFLPQFRRQRQGIQAARAGIGIAESWREKTRRESMTATWGLESHALSGVFSPAENHLSGHMAQTRGSAAPPPGGLGHCAAPVRLGAEPDQGVV